MADQQLIFCAAAGASAGNILGMRMPISEGVVGWVVREDQPALVPDAYADERFYRKMDQDIDFRTQSILCSPLRVDKRVIGAIELVDVRREALSEEGLRLLSQVADQAALLILNQRLLGETRRQAHKLSMLLEVSNDLTSTLETEETLHLISSRVLDLVKANGCHVFLLQTSPDGNDLLVPVASSDPNAEQILDTPLKVGQGITGSVAESGIGVMVNRVDLDSRGFQVPGTPRDPESLISVPLISDGNMIGVMTVSRLGDEGFVKSDLNIVSAMASQAAAALDKSRLFKEVRQRSQELAALNAVVSTASQSLSLEEILQATLERVTEIMPGSAGLICLKPAATDALQLAAQRNLPDSLVQRFRGNGMHGTLCAVTARLGKVYVVPDLSEPLSPVEQGEVETSSLVNMGLQTYLGTPLVAHGQILGTLSVFGSEPNTFTPADVDLLTAIGQQIGIAVRNAQLFEQTEHALEESTALHEASQAISSSLKLEDVLQITVNRMTEYVGADQSSIILFDTSTNLGKVMATYPPSTGTEREHIPLKGNLKYEVLRDKSHSVSIEDVCTHPVTEEDGEVLGDRGTKSMLLVPLIVQGRLIGSIELYITQARRSFTASEISFCRTLADRAGLAVENRRLFSQTFFTLQETTLLYQASRALTQAQNLNDVLHAITDNLPVKQIDQCWIALVDPDLVDYVGPANQSIEIKAMWDHEGGHDLLHTRFSARELPFIGQPQAIETWVINDLDNETALDTQSINTLRSFGARSALIVPLTIGETPMGWLILITHHHTHVFHPEQIRPYQTLADQAAVVIRNQQLLQQVQDSLKEVETAHRQYLHSEWTRFLESKDKVPTAVAYDHGMLLPSQDLWHPLIGDAVSQGAPVIDSSGNVASGPNLDSANEREDAPGQGSGTTEDQGGISVVTPLKVRGQVIGALGLGDPEHAHEWTAEELGMVQEIADRVAQAVENARLLEETQTSLAETERLYRATSQLSNAETADEVIKVLAEEVCSALGPAFSGTILRAGPAPSDHIDWLEASAQWNLTTLDRGVRFATADYPVLHRFIGQVDPVIIDDTDLTLWEDLPQVRPRSVTAIPLVAGNSWLGAINIVSQEESRLNTRTMRLLQNLADRAAVALESVRLYGETQRRAIQLEAAAKVSRAATSILEQDRLLSSVVELIRDHLNYDDALVFLLDPAKRWAVLRASTGEIGHKLLQDGHALEVGGNSLIGHVTGTGEPREAYNLDFDPAHIRIPDLPAVRSELAIPLKIGQRVIGALDVHSTEPNAFGPDDIAVLSTLSDQLAVAIENARLYQEQLETTTKLREVDRLKTQFLANMSHELRTPLNSIIGFSKVILKGIDGPVTELQQQDLEAIYSSGQLLLRLINDILDLSKIEAGKMELAFAETDLEEIIMGVLSTTSALVKDKPEIELRHNVAPGLPPITADATRLRQILLNLLSNAAKFTAKGYIELSVTYDTRFVTMRVKDTGIGIPADKFDLIFQEFEQVDGSTTRSVGGTGLGLPISRHFVEMHGGRIWVESELGIGSTFAVQLPIKGSQVTEEKVDEIITSSDRNLILAIDDDADVIRLYKRYLERQNYQVIGLPDGKHAVQKTRELRPYAILLDLLLPGKNGWAIIQELKADPETKDIPIIMCSIVSASGRGFSLGAADYLVKPIADDQLLTALARLEDGAYRESKEARQVVIIDDTPEDRSLLRRIFESAGEPYNVVEASGGFEGIEVIRQLRPDLVVLDLMMPEMDGFAVLEALKSDRDLRRIPIVVVTAKELTEQERTQINGQVTALFQKGLFKVDELLQDLNSALDRVRQFKREKVETEE